MKLAFFLDLQVVMKGPQVIVVRCGSSRIADRARKPLAMVRVKLLINLPVC
jgi:hypothetical protein